MSTEAERELQILRLDMANRLCARQWTGGPDQAYWQLREHMLLLVDVVLPVIDWTRRGVLCRCPMGPGNPHERGDECSRPEEADE